MWRAYHERVRALVVEDDVRTAALLKRGLSEEGYAVDVALDGPDGAWRASEFGYDVVVLDVLLPGLDGFEVCRLRRGAGACPHDHSDRRAAGGGCRRAWGLAADRGSAASGGPDAQAAG